ncbi:hypothetical protein Hdeb2414_s0162g00818951 [Helianthus debilis subsp. tardiflorus]
MEVANKQATWIILAAFSRNPVLPTIEPVAPAFKKGGFSTFPFLKDGIKTGKHDKTPCNEESSLSGHECSSEMSF